MLGEVRRSGAVWWEDYEVLWNQRADVLVCHEAPSCHRQGFREIDGLAQAMGARRIFHGHHHVTYQDQVAGGIQVYGVGLRGIVDQDGRVIRPGRPILDDLDLDANSPISRPRWNCLAWR